MFVHFTVCTILLLLQANPLDAGIISILGRRQLQNGFTLVPNGSFKGLGLTSVCEQVLYQTINCDNFTQTLNEPKYHSSLNNTALTASVCATSCGTALATARRRISGACVSTPDIIPGYPVLALIDKIYTGWNETCLKDNGSSRYCNDIIDSWTPVETLEAMPKTQLCSYCYGAKLRLMRSSPYSGYNELYAVMLEYVNKNCNGDVTPTDPLPNPIKANQTDTLCSSGESYNTRSGDTCDSIALAKNISSASLYYVNPNLVDCGNIRAGLNLCLPLGCKTYTVKSTDRCVAVAVDNSATWQDIVEWNMGIDAQCSNLYGAEPSFGTTICVSPPGGKTDPDRPGNSTIPGNGNSGGHGGSGDGYADDVTKPPSGIIADGTTKNCGDYIQGQKNIGCPGMIAPYAMTMDLFLAINPSLKSVAECTSDLKDGVWYCLHPVRWWNNTVNGVSSKSIPDSLQSPRIWVPSGNMTPNTTVL